ncbi:translocation/assembly module TamB domain-containing protein [Pseudogulbenkiania ferrooxidans]|uniref:Translocation and assembly module TamB C-terminal domain-containing protein n=1 Tax=Pseudogulbenkiania ferrooxidans 2002 TaxID=279714 RepID=B9YY69_9NEIS|nr:translocation/assembly module TamB domain-containing protein [Pseudogulbenkiania ferrooxidans]EEG10072.1 protein of unknown function DUF490 [Pseudogulbenkiania ferrooxidans 2002]
MTQAHPDSPDDTPASANPPPHRGWRPLRWLAAGALALLLALAAFAGWVTASGQGFAWAWRTAAELSHGRLGVGAVRGTLWQGFELQRLRWQDPAQRLEVERLRLDWQPSALWRGTLHLTRLELGHVRLTSLAAAAPAAPPQLPASLALPLTVELDRFALASLTLLPGDVRLYDVAGAYRYQGGRHQVQLARLNSPWGGGGAALTLADARPFALSGTLSARGTLEQVAIKADLALAGSLADLQARGTVAGRGLLAEVSGRFDPFAASALNRFRRLDVRVGGVNPQALQPSWPKARLNFAVYAEPAAGATVAGGLSLINSEAGALSAGQLPLAFLAGEFRVRGQRLTLNALQAQLAGGGRVALNGTLDAQALALTARLQDVALRALHASAPDQTVGGTLTLDGTPAKPTLSAALQSRQLALEARLAREPGAAQALRLERLQLTAGGGRLALSGRVELQQARRFELSGALEKADPARFLKGAPVGDLNARLTARGQLAAPLAATLRLQFAPSRLSGAPLTGRAELDLQPGRLKRLDADLRLADNRLQAAGAYGAAGDRLKLLIDAPNLRLLGPGFTGRIGGQLDLAGTPKLPLLSANLKAERLALPGGVGVEALTLAGELQADTASPFRVQLAAQQLRLGEFGASTLRLNAVGQRNRHRIELDGRLTLKQRPYALALRANGGLAAGSTQWQGTLQTLQLAGQPGLTLLAPASLSVGPQRLELGAARLAMLGGQVELQQLRRDASGLLNTRGRAAGLRLAELAPLLALPVQQTLVVSGDWALSGRGVPQGQLNLQRVGGDVWLPGSNGRPLALELGTSRVGLRLDANRAQLELQLQSRYLNASGNGALPLAGGIDGRTPLAASLRLEVPALKALAGLAGPGLELGGQLAANVTLSGPLAAPLAYGRLDGKGLLFADRKTGLRLAEGVLEARLDGRRLLLDRLRFASGEGEALASGALDLKDRGPDATVRLSLKRFSVFDRPNRRLVVSGDSDILFVDNKLTLTGRLRADQGRVELPKQGTPQLSDDVHVVGREAPPPSALATLPVTVRLDLDLGERFRFTGQGLDVELSGVVHVSAAPGEAPAARGQVRVVKGRYKAYGQDLDIEYGTITFTGSLDNPALNVRAKRRLSPVGAGVEVGGSVAAPSVRLIADEALSERDKLSWLVLGRASVGGSDDASLAAAAGALLAGTINDRIGLFDDLGLVNQQGKTLADGTVSPAEQVVTVGRQLTRTLYLGYEYGIASASQALKMSYQLSKGWSLVLRAGTTASLETRYTLRFD